jgi:hypothetical protein
VKETKFYKEMKASDVLKPKNKETIVKMNEKL